MDGAAAIYTILSGNAALTAVVAAEYIITDDVLAGGGLVLPAIQLETISSVDLQELNYGAEVHVRQRVRIRIHAKTAVQRASVRALVRAALFANRFPTVTGISNVTVNTDGEGPDGLAPDSDVRIGIQDAVVFYNQSR
jgi:hypothetical protein